MWRNRPNVFIELDADVRVPSRGPKDTIEEMAKYFQHLKDAIIPHNRRYWHFHETHCDYGLSEVHIIMSMNPIGLKNLLL